MIALLLATGIVAVAMTYYLNREAKKPMQHEEISRVHRIDEEQRKTWRNTQAK